MKKAIILRYKINNLMMLKQKNILKFIFQFSFIIVCILIIGSSSAAISEGRIRYTIDKNEWKFKREEVKNGESVSLDDSKWLTVSIPHDFNGEVMVRIMTFLKAVLTFREMPTNV